MAEIELDGINGVDEYLSSFDVVFEDVFMDWVIANYLDATDGPYSYPDRVIKVQDLTTIPSFGENEGTLPQFSARYFELRLESGDALVSFEGNSRVGQVGTTCRSRGRCWWGNIGDSIDSTLTREFDLALVDEATLEFWIWYDIEEDWDYAYVEASRDGGATWDILEGASTTLDNPVGNSYGAGWTGRRREWTKERIDLSDYVGRPVLVRFEYITDDAVNLDGVVLDDIAVPEIDYIDFRNHQGVSRVLDLEVRWDFDSDGTWDTEYSLAKQITHQFHTATTQQVALQVRDTAGQTHTTSKELEVLAASLSPQAHLTVTPQNQHGPPENGVLSLHLDATASWDAEDSNGDLLFRWDFEGDGTWDTDYSVENDLTYDHALSETFLHFS